MLGFLSPDDGEPKVEKIEGDKALSLVEDEGATVLDVREDAELRATGKAAGAVHVPLGLVEEVCIPGSPDCPPELSVDKPVVIYCGAGVRAQQAGEILIELGYQKVYNMGGFGNWEASGGAVEPVEA